MKPNILICWLRQVFADIMADAGHTADTPGSTFLSSQYSDNTRQKSSLNVSLFPPPHLLHELDILGLLCGLGDYWINSFSGSDN